MALNISRSFKDISLSFSRHPVTNDIIPIKNEDAIKRSVINLVRTRVGERFFNSLIGTSVEDSLFENQDESQAIFIREQIETTLKNFEPRIRVRNVIVEFPLDTNEMNVKIDYDIVGLGFPSQNIEFLLLPSRV
jgi:phage baseplate assembly protein W